MKKVLGAGAFLMVIGTGVPPSAQERGPNCFTVSEDLDSKTPYRCVPEENLAPTSPLNVAGVDLAMPSTDFQNCQQIANPYPPLIGGQQPRTAGLVCKKDDTVFTADVIYSDSEFLVREMAVYICGPLQDAPGSEFQKALTDRYGSPASRDGYFFVKDWLSLEVFRIGSAGTSETRGAKTCAPGTAMWRFTMKARPTDVHQQHGQDEIPIKGAPQFRTMEARMSARAKAKAAPVERF